MSLAEPTIKLCPVCKKNRAFVPSTASQCRICSSLGRRASSSSKTPIRKKQRIAAERQVQQ